LLCSSSTWLTTKLLRRISVPLSPRELATPYASPAEKTADWQRLLLRAATLRELTSLADVPEDKWPQSEAIDRLRAAPPISTETTSQRLSRWRNVFADELADLDRAVAAASWQATRANLSDIDLRSAVYLAGRLLATLYNMRVNEVRP
jgi:hypothetical protein